MRFLPTYQTVENMRLGMNPEQAAQVCLLFAVLKARAPTVIFQNKAL